MTESSCADEKIRHHHVNLLQIPKILKIMENFFFPKRYDLLAAPMLYSLYNNRRLLAPHDIRLPWIYLRSWFRCRLLQGFADKRESCRLTSGDVTSGCRPNPIYTTLLPVFEDLHPVYLGNRNSTKRRSLSPIWVFSYGPLLNKVNTPFLYYILAL